MTRFGVCWVAPSQTFANGIMWAFLYWLVLFTFGVAVYVLYDARGRLSKGLRETAQFRAASFKAGAVHVALYAAFWLVVACFYWSTLPFATAPAVFVPAWVFCLLFCARGVPVLGAWLLTHDLRAIAAADARARPGRASSARWRASCSRR